MIAALCVETGGVYGVARELWLFGIASLYLWGAGAIVCEGLIWLGCMGERHDHD